MVNKIGGSTTPDERLHRIFEAGHVGDFWADRINPFRTFGDLIFEGPAYRVFIEESKALHKTND